MGRQLSSSELHFFVAVLLEILPWFCVWQHQTSVARRRYGIAGKPDVPQPSFG
jgi:hypothetical protein